MDISSVYKFTCDWKQHKYLMKTFTALIKATVNGSVRAVPTQIHAQNSTDARWLLQAIYGFHALVSAPIEVNEDREITEVIQSKTSEQVRLDTLKAAKDRANDALKVERDRQARQRATKALANSNKLLSTRLKTPTL
jgi:hypothetical protein